MRPELDLAENSENSENYENAVEDDPWSAADAVQETAVPQVSCPLHDLIPQNVFIN